MHFSVLKIIVLILTVSLLLLYFLFNTRAFKYRLFCKDSHSNYLVIETEDTDNLGPYSTKSCQCPGGSDIIEIDSDLLGELQSSGIGHSGGGVQGEDILFRWDIEELQTANNIVSEFISCPLRNNDDTGQNDNNSQEDPKGEKDDFRDFIPKLESDPKQMSKEVFDSLEDKFITCPRKYSFFNYLRDLLGPIKAGNLNDPINVAILDTPCDRDAIQEYLDSETNINFELRVENVTCTNPYKTENVNHGTAVVIRFIQKLVENNNTRDVNIGVYNILDSNGSVRLSSVLCAMAEAKEDKRTHFNMSFGFGVHNAVFEQKINDLVNDSNVEVVSCSIGNDKLEIGFGSNTNVPSAYSNATANYSKIKQVIGLSDSNQVELWSLPIGSSSVAGSNYIFNEPRLFAAKATFNGAGGTSFAAPRILADHISGVTFGVAQPVIHSLSGNLIAIIEN